MKDIPGYSEAWRLLRKDWHYARVLVVATWVAWLAAGAVQIAETDASVILFYARGLVFWFPLLLTAVSVYRLVRLDSWGDGFLSTRPVDRVLACGAKLAFAIGLLGLVPAAIRAAFLAVAGVGLVVRDWGLLLAEYSLAGIAFVTFVAVVTWAARSVIQAVCFGIAGFLLLEFFPGRYTTSQDEVAKLTLILLGFLAVFLAARSLSIRQVRIYAAAALVLALVVRAAWPWDFINTLNRAATPMVEPSPLPDVSISPGRAMPHSYGFSGGRYHSVHVTFSASGFALDESLEVVGITSHAILPDGRTVVSAFPADPSGRTSPSAAYALLGFEPVKPRRIGFHLFFSPEGGDLQEGDVVTIEGEVEFAVHRWYVRTRHPFSSERIVFSDTAESFNLSPEPGRNGRFAVRAVGNRVRFSWMGDRLVQSGLLDSQEILLHSPGNKKYILRRSGTSMGSSMRAPSVSRVEGTFRFATQPWPRGDYERSLADPEEVPEGWFDEAELVFIDRKQVGTVRLPFRVENVTLR